MSNVLYMMGCTGKTFFGTGIGKGNQIAINRSVDSPFQSSGMA